MKYLNKSSIWKFIHKTLKMENWPENYNEKAQLNFLEDMLIKCYQIMT